VMCSIPIHIYFTRTVQPEPMALWALLGFLYYSDRSWILALLLGALAPLLKLSFLYVLFPLWFFLGYEREGWKVLKNVRWIVLLAGILILTESWYHYAKTASIIILPLSAREHFENLKPVLTWNLWRAQFVSRIPELVFTYTGLLLAGFGLYHYGKQRSTRFFLCWAAASALYMPLLGEYGLIHRYTLLPLAPVAAVWIACGISALRGRKQTSRRWRVFIALLVVGIPVHAALRIKHWYRVEHRYLDHLRETLARVSRPDDLVLVATHDKPIHLYYMDRFGFSIEPAHWGPGEVNGYLARGARFILIPLEDNRNGLEEWQRYLAYNGQPVETNQDYWLYRMDGSGPLARQG